MGLGGIKLAEYADPRAVSRGVGIAANAASIVDRRVRRSDDVAVVTGRVASASGIADYFSADVVFADFESRIIDYDCDCPAAARFDGMCKHCVALTVAYFAQPKSFEEACDGRVAVPSARKTSEALAQCLVARPGATCANAGSAVAGAALGTVHLAVHLAYDGRFWSMSLDAEGPQGTYVVRDVEAFAHRVQRGEFFSYGKKLAFAHRLEVFDESSRAVARTLAELFPDERLFGGSTFRAVSGKREVRLREAELAGMLGAMGEGASFVLERREGEAMTSLAAGRGGERARVGAKAQAEAKAPAERGGLANRASGVGEAARWVVAEDAPALSLEFLLAEGVTTCAFPRTCLWCAGWKWPSCWRTALPRGRQVPMRVLSRFCGMRDLRRGGRPLWPSAMPRHSAGARCPCWRRRLRWICPRRGRRCALWPARLPSTST